MLVTWGAGMVKTTLVLLPTPPSVTFTGPLVAAEGTVATICASLQLFTVALVPLKVTVLVPCVSPKPLPLICTWVPTGPLVGDKLATIGLGKLNSTSWLLATPLTVTFTAPVVVPEAIVATIWVSLQLFTVAVVPLKAIVLQPCVAWNPQPLTGT